MLREHGAFQPHQPHPFQQRRMTRDVEFAHIAATQDSQAGRAATRHGTAKQVVVAVAGAGLGGIGLDQAGQVGPARSTSVGTVSQPSKQSGAFGFGDCLPGFGFLQPRLHFGQIGRR